MNTDTSLVSVEVLDSVPSTMDAARERVASGAFRAGLGQVACDCVMAWEQTAGRGQRGRAWYAARGESLCATYMLRCATVTEPDASAQLGLLAGVATAGALLLKEFSPIIGLKWPNDVLLNGKKAGGILVELIKAPGGAWVALVGVGLNVSVRRFPSDLEATATSLLIESVPPTSLPELPVLARDIGDSLGSWALQCRSFSEYGIPGAIHPVIHMWRNFDATSGRRYETDREGRTVPGIAEGIGDDGALLLRLDDGSHTAVTSATSLREVPA